MVNVCSTCWVRWQSQSVDVDEGALPGLDRAGLVRRVQTPEFDGVTFHEVLCKSALNKMPVESGLPFKWSINPMRGCTHACRYCFARGSHEYLDLDAGRDFDSQIVVKMNVAAVLRRELARRSWHHEMVALGTDTDPYQRAEGRYRLMPGIIRALAESRTPFGILTKGTLMRRDLPLLVSAARQVDVSIGVSLSILDQELHTWLEPGAPAPAARLDLIRAFADAGFPVRVMVAPVMPYLTDGERHLDALFDAIATAGASGVTVLPLHLRGATRGWFLGRLAEQHPALIGKYRRLYGRSAYVTPEYSQWLRSRVAPLVERHGLRPKAPSTPPEPASSELVSPEPARQLELFG